MLGQKAGLGHLGGEGMLEKCDEERAGMKNKDNVGLYNNFTI